MRAYSAMIALIFFVTAAIVAPMVNGSNQDESYGIRV